MRFTLAHVALGIATLIAIAHREIVGRSGGSFVFLLLSLVFVTCGCTSARPNPSPLLQVTPTAGRAGLIPGSWKRVEGLRMGSLVVVTLKSGDRLEGALKASALGALTLIAPTGQELMIAQSDVGRIVAKMKDGLTNGALTGAGVGFGAALVVLAIAGSRDGYVLPSAKWGAPLLLSALGSLGGMLVDRAHMREEVVYVAP